METIDTQVVEDKSRRYSRGRRIMDEQRREELLARYETSGLTQKAFAKREGVNIHTFVSWLAQRRRDKAGNAPETLPAHAPARFVELSAPASRVMDAAMLEVVLRDGRIVRGNNEASLATLARLLEC